MPPAAAAVPDHRQKGLMHPTSRSPEALLVRELVPALQGNPAAAAACLKLEASLTGEALFHKTKAICLIKCAVNLPNTPFLQGTLTTDQLHTFACDG
jgi:hypothetical protein